MPTATALAQALRHAVRVLDFPSTSDHWQGGQPAVLMPSIDLAVVSFVSGRKPRWANVLFSREHPQGVVADIGADGGPVCNVQFVSDERNALGESTPWLPGSDWSAMPWRTLHGTGPHRVVAPYPASLLKLMVAVGVGMAVDAGRTAWPDALEPMVTHSDNDATDTCVALLHRCGVVATLNQRFAALRLPTLQLNNTQASGGWRNASGAGVGQIHMTAWDTVRLLWLLDAQAPPAPWLPASLRESTPLLQPATRDHLRAVLARQTLDEVLSSGRLRDVPGWVPGLPDAPAFAHKTGCTDNYASDAGIVHTHGAHYIVAVLTSLGRRYAPHPRCATTWRLPALGAVVHALMSQPA
jgi:hypothetical protein